MKMREIAWVVLIVWFGWFSHNLSFGLQDRIEIGEKVKIVSEILGEEREILISLPPDYENLVDGCPVLIILDGRYHFFHAAGLVEYLIKIRRIPPVIVVAVASRDRNRDFLPTRMAHIPTSGNAKRFLSFIEKELMPAVDKKYKTVPFRILMGHSFGGTFALYAMQQKPRLFNGYIIVSGALWWDSKLLIKSVVPFFKKTNSFDRFIYISVGNESMALVHSFREFSKILRNCAPSGLRWKSDFMKGENHASTPHISLYRGLEFVFKRWFHTMNSSIKGVEEFQKQFQKLPGYYGYPMNVTERMLNAIGYGLIQQNKAKEAIGFFQLNVTNHPDSPNVYDSLGEAYEVTGELGLAEKNYSIAIKIAEETKNININIFKTHLNRIRNRKAKKIEE